MNTSFSKVAAMALMAALVAAAPVQAETPDEDATVRVVNFNKADVRVFVFDADGHRTLLGTVSSGDVRELDLEETLIAQGAVQVKVYPVGTVAGLGAPAEAANGIKSNLLHLDGGDVVDVWVEPQLESTMVRITRG